MSNISEVARTPLGVLPLSVNEEEVGTSIFQSVLTLLVSEYPDIDDLKFKTVAKTQE